MAIEKLLSKNEEFDYGIATIHLFVAIIFGLLFIDTGELIKIVLLPYLFFTLKDLKKEALPGLLILMCYGTILTVLAAIIIIGISFLKINELKKKKLFPLWLLLICSFPFYAYNTFTRIFELDYSLVESLIFNDYYLAFWFLFYGALNKEIISKKSISFVLFLTIFLIFLDKVDYDSELGFRSLYRLAGVAEIIILLFLLLIWRKMITLTDDIYVRLSIVIFILTRIFLGFPEHKFTFIFGLIISLTFILQKDFFLQKYNSITLEKKIKVRSFLFSILPIPFLIITLIVTPLMVQNYAAVDMTNYYNDGQSLFDKIMAKLFVDRGLLWIGAIQGIIENTVLTPPIEEWFISFSNITQTNMDADFEAHSLIIELTRRNGYIMGFLLSITFLRWQYKLIMSSIGQGFYINIFRYAIFGVCISVFITGQYVLQLNTSFFFMTMTGALCSLTTEKLNEIVSTKKNIRKVKNGT